MVRAFMVCASGNQAGGWFDLSAGCSAGKSWASSVDAGVVADIAERYQRLIRLWQQARASRPARSAS